MNDILKAGIFDGLSEEEKAVALQILNEYKETGQSNTLTEIYEEDYEEIPVDIDTFIEDDRYIGSFTGNGSLIYGYWRRKLRELFRDPNQYQEVANTGSIGCLSHDTIYRTSIGDYALRDLIKLSEKGIKFNIKTEIGEETVNHVHDKGIQRTKKIVFSNGTEIEGTYDHRIRADINGSVDWIRFDEITLNSRIINTSRSMSYEFSESNIELDMSTNKYLEIQKAEIIYPVSITDGYTNVGDIEVEGSHTYLINGLISHNTGKSTVGCVCMTYMLYRVMCLRDPQAYFRLAAGSTIVFAFINNTLDLSSSVGYGTVQAIIQSSPWFLERGKVTGTKYKEYTPDKLIRFKVGSNAGHILGMNVFCVTGDTIIRTIDGDKKIEDLDGSITRVFSLSDKNQIILSEDCLIKKTKDTNEIYEIELENGSIIRCTGNHKFLLRSGEYKEAQYLTEDDELKSMNSEGTYIRSITKKTLDHSIPVYDVINANPYNNFLIKTNNSYIVAHNCALLDEVNFKNGANVQMEKSKIMETYNGVLERMGSRFMVNGKIAGKLFIISSKKSEYDFLESYIRKKASDPSVFVCDAKLWEVKPTGTYSGRMFNVAIGGKNLQSRILDENEDVETLRKQGYEILEVPVEFKERFRMDIQAALMNIAGISISEVTKFIPYPNLAKSYGKDQNPFTNQILTIGTKDNYSISDYFRPELVSDMVRSKPIYIHIDGSLTGDRTGISGVAIMGIKEEIRYVNDEFTPIQELVYKHVFSVGIQCPPGAEISLQKNREFIYYLKYNLGFNICGISLDGFQSADSKQQFLQAGFPARILSLDRTPDGYMYLKASINEKRIQMLNIPILETELINLEQNNMTGKVDHNPENSKDISDSVAGALWNASQIDEDEKAKLHILDDFGSFSEINDKTASSELRDSVLKNMQNDLLGVSAPSASNYEDIIGEMNNETNKRAERIKQLRANLTPQENFRVSDDELESALYNQDDDFLVW